MHANSARSSVTQAGLPLWMDTRALRAFVRTVMGPPAEAQRLTVVREARAFFWERIRAMRAPDVEWGR
jgi:hypothetical protein